MKAAKSIPHEYRPMATDYRARIVIPSGFFRPKDHIDPAFFFAIALSSEGIQSWPQNWFYRGIILRFLKKCFPERMSRR